MKCTHILIIIFPTYPKYSLYEMESSTGDYAPRKIAELSCLLLRTFLGILHGRVMAFEICGEVSCSPPPPTVDKVQKSPQGVGVSSAQRTIPVPNDQLIALTIFFVAFYNHRVYSFILEHSGSSSSTFVS